MKKKNNIKIFYEKSKKIGNGHLIRSYRFYKNLKKKGFKCEIYENKKKSEIESIINKTDKRFYLVLDYKHYRKIKFKINKNIKKVFTFENIYKEKFSNCLNIFPLDIQYKNYSGPKFFQFPYSFYKIRSKKFFFKKTPNILVIQGGTDANNNLNKILYSLIYSKFKFKYNILVKVNNINQISKKLQKNNKIKIIQEVKSIDKIFKSSSIAISACGNTAFELGYLGTPTIHCTNEKREITRAKIFEKKKLGIFCEPQNKKKLVDEINKLYNNLKYRNNLITRRIKYFRKKNILIELFR